MSKQRTRKTGLAFSGGGIRSAAFCSGVMRRLLQKGVSIDYLSTVSGGGYTGASYMDWKFRNGNKDDPVWHKEYFEHMRKHINPLCDCYNPCRGFIDAVVIIVYALFLSIGISLLRSFAFVIPIAYTMDNLFGDILRNQFTCHDANINRTVEGMSKKSEMRNVCVPKFGPGIEELFELWFPLFAVFVVSYYLSTLGYRRTMNYLLSCVSLISGLTFAMTFLPWMIEVYTMYTPRWANYLILVLVLIIWAFFPRLREQAFIAILILVYAYFVKWRVFKTPLFGLKYTRDVFWILVWVCGILLWLHPYLGLLQLRGAHLYVEWRLKRAYFSPSKSTISCSCCCCQTDEDKELSLADLVDVQPEYKCNVTVNQWRKYDGEREKDYEILTLSPTGIERIDRTPEEKEFDSQGFIKPKDIALSSAMTTSAAAVSYDNGGYEDKNKSFREVRIVLGLGIGNNIVAQVGLTKTYMSWVVTLVLQLFFGMIIIFLPAALYFRLLNDREYWERVGVIAFLSAFVLMALVAILPNGYPNKGFVATLIRWCSINILHVRLMSILFGVTDVGPVPPPILNLSDGGHAENLGLLPLLKLRLPRIVAVNGGDVEPGRTYASDLLKAVKQAREKLRCSFTGINGRDIEEDIRQEFVETSPGYQPRSYRFKVHYYETSDFEEKQVGEGEVMLLMPRHPDDGIRQFEDRKWNDFDDDDVKLDLDESAWGSGPALKASEVDRLTGCCFECCHLKSCSGICNALLGEFPLLSSFNQMFTPSQFTAYHREGYRACLEGQGVAFLGKRLENQSDVVMEQPRLDPDGTTIIEVRPVD